MGKDWDAPWKLGAGMMKPGIGDRDIPWPAYGAQKFGGSNPTCQTCGGRARGSNRCSCEEPDWHVSGKPLSDDVNDSASPVVQRQRFQAWCVLWLVEVYRVLKPGGVIKVFGATRMFHRMAAAMEEAGFFLPPEHSLEAWMYGCLSEDTEVLTEDGWAPYHRATVGTLVMGFDPVTERFIQQPVEETFEYPYDREAFRIHGDGTDQIVSVKHRCLVGRDGKWEVVVSGDLAETETMPCLQSGVHSEGVGSEGMWALLLEPAAGLQEEALVRAEGPDGGLLGLRDREVVRGGVAAEGHQAADVFQEVQRSASGAGLGEARAQGSGSQNTRELPACRPEDDRLEEPGMEGRGDVRVPQRELQADQMRPLSAGVSVDGSVERVRRRAQAPGGEGTGPNVDEDRSGSSCEPRLSGQSAGEPDAVRLESGSQAVRAPRSTSPDLVRVSARVERIHYTGTVWCVRVPTGAFVVRRKGMAFVTGNSGFPKYPNTSKAIDKAARGVPQGGPDETSPNHGKYKTQATEGSRGSADVGQGYGAGPGAFMREAGTLVDLPLTTPDAEKFDGWATALKPGWEPFLVGVKAE